MERRKDTVEIAGPHRREKEVLLQSCRGVYEVSLGAAQTFSISECTNLPKGQQRVLLQTPENRFDFLFFLNVFYYFILYVYLFIYFIFGCVGSSLLRVGFLVLWHTGSVVVALRLSSCGLWGLEGRLSSCGAWA